MRPEGFMALGKLLGSIIVIIIVVHVIFSISRTARNSKKQLEILQRQEKERIQADIKRRPSAKREESA